MTSGHYGAWGGIDTAEDFAADYGDDERSSDLWGDITDFLKDSREPDSSPQFMNNQDYTLNSPMIIDELDEFINFLKSDLKSPLYYSKVWDLRKTWLKKLNINWTNITKTSDFHKTCAKYWRTTPDVSAITELIKAVDHKAKLTHSVLESYVQGWLKRKIPFNSRRVTSPIALKYGAYMMDSMIITWILNATTEYEIYELMNSNKIELLTKGEPTNGVKYSSKIFGEVYIGHGVLYFPQTKSLWDRNMLLMFKDVCIARFQSLFAIQHRQFEPYHKDHLGTLEKLYRAGDMMLNHDMVSSYEGFGMIEPLSSLKLAEMAGKMRPLIPEFPHFKNHLKEKGAELIHRNPYVQGLLDTIESVTDKRILLTIYGSFRHWGHPFIDYMEGLKALHANVTSTKDVIDKSYANKLASDLAYKILRKEFRKQGKWFVDGRLVAPEHPLKEHIVGNTWPAIDTILSIPDTWHELPLIACWEIPEVVDPSMLYSDKTHSINLDELIAHLSTKANKPIPTRKVLDTLIHTTSTNWPEFLKEINDVGLDWKSLIIGLKGKEREIKWKGRFFALMSWKLREYFVFTEYLIKSKILPLFRGLTMADDQTTLTKKLLTNTMGQGGKDYSEVTIANHIDYEKWNNFQRREATDPVFTVMGKFFGYPKLFSRTHEFFERSLIYYRDRPDLMKIENGRIVNRFSDQLVCWDGQAGGLEGLRQKGWSVLNLLVIERESRIRNTEVKTLAQGDNQVICTQYKLNPAKTEGDLRKHLQDIVQNNHVIINAIRKATARIGLRINEDETLQAADMLIYGKIIIYRGNITCLEEKRYSRITCTTNDQLPSLGNVMSTVATNCLTVSHYSKSPLNAMVQYNWMGNFVLHLLNLHNPALRCKPSTVVSKPPVLDGFKFLVECLYLDPSIGGICGMSLTRFHIRMFPDPVTESLTFWKNIYTITQNTELRKLAISNGNPKLSSFTQKQIRRLLEDPTSLNVPRGLSAQNLIKDEIKQAMLQNPQKIKHEVVRDALKFVKHSEVAFMTFLASINPCFPRFLSEIRSASYFGLTDSILGLFENSKTIRNLFKRKFRARVDEAIVKCELSSIESLIRSSQMISGGTWSCSASQADLLRRKSWGREIVGTTIPHPAEMIKNVTNDGVLCAKCKSTIPEAIKIIVIIPGGIDNPEEFRGPYPPYFGSATAEHTSLIQSWEKGTDITFIRKASNLRRVFHWFVDPRGNLGRSITQNLESLTGEKSGSIIEGFQRTGSAIHRFGCSRVSQGGFMANNSVYGSRMIISSDNFQLLGDKNYDFMYQSLMLFAQQTAGELHNESSTVSTYHFHISCTGCLREIQEPTLEAGFEYKFTDMSKSLEKWKPQNTKWMKEALIIDIPVGDWDNVPVRKKSTEVGMLQGLMFGHLCHSYSDTNILDNLFPLGLRNKLYAPGWLSGIRDGLYRAAVLEAIHRRIFYKREGVDEVVRACYIQLVDQIIKHPDFLVFTQTDAMLSVLRYTSQRVPPSYPLNNSDLGVMARTYLMDYTVATWKIVSFSTIPELWIFADFTSAPLAGILLIAYDLCIAYNFEPLIKFRKRARELSDLLAAIRSGEVDTGVQQLLNIYPKVYQCRQEVRHAIKSAALKSRIAPIKREEPVFTNKVFVGVDSYPIEYTTESSDPPAIIVPRIQNPLVSGIRIPQIATGSPLKVQGILSHLKLSPIDILCGGDGSGGISACLLRMYSQSKLIFNSLLDLRDVELSGALPRPPSAIDYMAQSVKDRCVNLTNAWETPMDLSKPETWIGFLSLRIRYQLTINLAVFDMEIQDENSINKIDKLMAKYLPRIMEVDSTVIVKTYLGRLISKDSILITLGSRFHIVLATQSELSSSQTSEVYVVMRRFRTRDVIPLYPLWSSLEDLRTQCYCMRSYEKEFKRARRLLSLDLVAGIPQIYLPAPESELFSIWESIGRDKVVLQKWHIHIYSARLTLVGYVWATTVMLSSQVIRTTRWLNESEYEIPSDNTLSRLFAYYVGSMLYIALVTDNLKLAQTCQSMIDRPFCIFFNYKKRMTGPGAKLTRYSTCWSLHEKNSSDKHKKVYIQNNMALIGSTIRYWLHVSKRSSTMDVESWISKLTLINKSITEESIRSDTGLYDIAWDT